MSTDSNPSPPPLPRPRPPLSQTDQIQQKLETNNVFLIARRQVDVGGVNPELMYMSLKFINNIWVLVEVKVAPMTASVGVRGPIPII